MKFKEVDTIVKYIILEEVLYLRVGPACWYYKDNLDYKALGYNDAVDIENTYQKLKESYD